MMRQYFDLKAAAGDAILFFRMGDFYEIFGDDAELVAPKLQLVLTARERGDQTKIPFCGVPHHSARNYWLKLIKLGYKVAFADQIEDPKEAKGLVQRAITRFITPASVDDLEGLEQDAPNYLLSIYQDPKAKKWVALVADASTGELRLGNFNFDSELLGLLERFKPKELLARKFIHEDLQQRIAVYTQSSPLLLSPLPENPLRDEEAKNTWFKKVAGGDLWQSLSHEEIEGSKEIIAASMAYFRDHLTCTDQFVALRPLQERDVMVIDETARRDLELFETARTRRAQGSLFYDINRCLTPMGARLLRARLAEPLYEYLSIQARQAGIAYLLAGKVLALPLLREFLKAISDLERLTTRLLAGTIQASELALIKRSLSVCLQLRDLMHQANTLSPLPKLLARLLDCESLELIYPLLTQALCDEVTNLGKGSGVFRKGYSPELDRLTDLMENGSQKIQAYETKLREQSGIQSLKIKSHASFGLLIEVTKANLAKVPKDFIRRQTMVNNERFVTTELAELSAALSEASEQAVAKEYNLFKQLVGHLCAYHFQLKEIASILAELDFLQGLACKAQEAKFSCPMLSEDGSIVLHESRHPVVEHFLGKSNFTPNSITIEAKRKHLLITGPNMAGKSTFMRQLALTAILHQMGSYIPAHAGRLPLFDRVFTRVGASDDLARGASTFLVEMSETAQILRYATSKSLVILDEVGRGTSTQDGLAIAASILQDLVQRVDCLFLFATHYHELVPYAHSFASVRTLQTEVLEKQDKITFTHRLIEGASGSSFGIEVAKIAGIPERIIINAKNFLAPKQAMDFSVNRIQETSGDKRVQEVKQRLQSLSLNTLTPIQALNILNELKNMLHPSEPKSLFD